MINYVSNTRNFYLIICGCWCGQVLPVSFLLEYTDAKGSALQTAQKAPISAQGFHIHCNIWAIIVSLLLGEIAEAEKTVFMQKGMKAALATYFELTNANFLYVEMLHIGNYCTADYFSCIMFRLFELVMSYSDLFQMK